MTSRWLLMLVLFLLLSLVVDGCGETGQYPYIDFNDTEQVQNVAKKSEDMPLRVALAAMTSTKSSISYYEELLDLLSKTLNRPVKLIQRNTYAEVNQLLRTGQIDVAFICTYSYVTGHDQFGLELVAAPVKNGEPKYQSYIIVRRDSGIESFADLKGKKFAFTDPMSTTGYLYPMSLLKKQYNSSPEKFFADYIFTFSHDNSIKAVSHGIVDGAAVESLVFKHMAENEPEVTSKVKIIKKSSEFASPPVVARPGLDKSLKRQLVRFLTTLDDTEQGRKILAKMGLEEFRQIDDAAYDSVRALGRELR
ncbi:MAG: phosphate/phosphite/phosphonate ABC transporter substrate-binding protein [Thermoanaerobacteraceae bacterium]|nr:phosphate/phosphite/phosphonate ABC transporter substrate-binding protein [Thermoanaerobacteraceae bacterium]